MIYYFQAVHIVGGLLNNLEPIVCNTSNSIMIKFIQQNCMINNVKSFGKITKYCQCIFRICFVIGFGTMIEKMYNGMDGLMFWPKTILVFIENVFRD